MEAPPPYQVITISDDNYDDSETESVNPDRSKPAAEANHDKDWVPSASDSILNLKNQFPWWMHPAVDEEVNFLIGVVKTNQNGKRAAPTKGPGIVRVVTFETCFSNWKAEISEISNAFGPNFKEVLFALSAAGKESANNNSMLSETDRSHTNDIIASDMRIAESGDRLMTNDIARLGMLTLKVCKNYESYLSDLFSNLEKLYH